MMKNIRRQGVILPEKREDYITSEEVRTISPGSLLKYFEGKTLDLLAIDPEGFDYEILKMTDLDRISPEAIIYEEAVFNEVIKKDCQGYLESHSYSCQSLHRDVLAVREAGR